MSVVSVIVQLQTFLLVCALVRTR